MERNYGLHQSLINNQQHSQASNINKEWLRQLFQEENLLGGKSWQMIKVLGGLNSLAKLIKTDLKDGITGTQKDMSWREKQFGSNKLIKLPKFLTFWTFWNRFFNQRFIFHLVIASLVSCVLNVCLQLNFGQSILTMVLLMGLGLLYAFYMIQIFNYNDGNKILTRQSNAIYIQFLKQYSKMTVRVKRDGIIETLKITECFTGDIILVQQGDIIPADGIVIEEQGFRIKGNNSNESEEKKSFTTQNVERMKDLYFVRSLSQVKSGQATILLMNVGFVKFYSFFQNQIKTEQRKWNSKLSQRIYQMQTYFDKSKFRMIVVILITLITKLLLMEQKLSWLQVIIKLIEVYQISCICLVIGSLKILKIGQKMFLLHQIKILKKFGISIKHSSVIENANYLTDICVSNASINSGSLKLHSIMIGEQVIYDGTNLNAQELKQKTNQKWRDLFLYLFRSTQKLKKLKQFTKLFMELGYPYHEIEQIQSTAIEHRNKNLRYKLISRDGKKFVAISADFEDVFKYCTEYTDSQGENNKMSSQYIKKIKQLVTQYQLLRCCRVQVICYKPINNLQVLFNDRKHEFLQSNLILVGLINMQFHVYNGVSEEIKMLLTNKMRVKLLSGNNLESCVSLAKEANILPFDFELNSDQQIAVQSAEMLAILHEIGFNHEKKSCNDIGKLRKFVTNVKVIARITAYQRRVFINALKMSGAVIGTIGIEDKQIIDLANISITNSSDNSNLHGNVITLMNSFQLYGMQELIISSRALNVYLSKLFKLSEVSKLVAISLIFLYVLFFSKLQLQFVVSILVTYSGILLFYSSMLRYIYLDNRLKKPMVIPILNKRNKKAIFLILLAQLATFIALIWIVHRALPSPINEEYDNEMVKYSSVLVRCYFFFQLFHFVSALKQNYQQNYFRQLNSESLSLFAFKQRKIILKALFIYIYVEIVLYAARIIFGQEIHALTILTAEIGGKLYICCLIIGVFLFDVDYIVDLFHWERLWGQYYPGYFQHLSINQAIQMIEL